MEKPWRRSLKKNESGVDVRKNDVLNFINFLHRIKRSYQRTATMGQHIQLKTNS